MQTQPTPATPMHANSDNRTDPAASESKIPIHAMEIDDTLPLPDPRMSRFMPWYFTKQHPPLDDTIDGIMSGVSFGESSVAYYGMGDIPINLSTESVAGSPTSTSRFQRIRRGLLRSFSFSKSRTIDDSDDDGSLSDFKDWTPPDSAYGAAFPICGWVPKHTRRAIEITIIALFVFAIVYFVVTTSIRVTNDRASSSSSSSSSSQNSESSGSSNKLADDNFYVDNYDNDYTYTDDVKQDDYFREMDDAINAGDDDAADDEDAGENGNGRQFL